MERIISKVSFKCYGGKRLPFLSVCPIPKASHFGGVQVSYNRRRGGSEAPGLGARQPEWKLSPAAHQLRDLGLVPEPLSTLVSSWVKEKSF